MLSMPFFWFIATLLIGFLNLFFANLLYLGIAAACLVAGIVSLFFDVVYFQLTVFVLCASSSLVLYYWLAYCRVTEDVTSAALQTVLGRSVTVHFWHEAATQVQLNGRVWNARYVENNPAKLVPGRFKVWKLVDDTLILM